MNVQSPYGVVSDFIAGEEIRDFFLGRYSNGSRNRFGKFRYKSSESILSELYSVGFFSIAHKLAVINDRTATKIIKGATYSGLIPLKFRIVESVTWLLVFLPLVFIFLDFFFGWTELSAVFYFYASACAISLLVTTKIAKKEWMVHNWNGKKKEG